MNEANSNGSAPGTREGYEEDPNQSGRSLKEGSFSRKGSSRQEREHSGRGAPPGHRELRNVFIRPEDKEEVQRVIATFQTYNSPSQVLWDHLQRELLPRIEKGNYFPRKLALEVAGNELRASGRKEVRVRLKYWGRVEAAAQTVSEDLRGLDNEIAWNGTLLSFPFCHCNSSTIIRAAAREIAERTRGGTSRFFSQESALSQRRSSGLSGKEATGQEATGQKPNDSQLTGREHWVGERARTKPGNQKLEKSPNRDRGGKPVMLEITAEAASKLKRKAEAQNRDGSELARPAIRKVIRWIEDSPAEALEVILEESPLYESREEGDYEGYQVYVEPETKRRLKRAKEFLRHEQEEGSGRPVTQREILQAAARWSIMSGNWSPPLPDHD